MIWINGALVSAILIFISLYVASHDKYASKADLNAFNQKIETIRNDVQQIRIDLASSGIGVRGKDTFFQSFQGQSKKDSDSKSMKSEP